MNDSKFLLAGTVMACNPEYLVIETKERRPSGDYPDEHVVYVEDAQELGIEPGDRIKLMGTIGVDPNDPRRLRLVAEQSNVKSYDNVLDTNIARVSGRLDRNFEFFAPVPEEGRKAFGNLLLVVNEEFYMRGVILQAAAAIATDRSNKYTYGTIVQIEGRIQTREFVANQGSDNEEDRVALEIVVNKATIIKSADSSDPFKEFEKETAEAL